MSFVYASAQGAAGFTVGLLGNLLANGVACGLTEAYFPVKGRFINTLGCIGTSFLFCENVPEKDDSAFSLGIKVGTVASGIVATAAVGSLTKYVSSVDELSQKQIGSFLKGLTAGCAGAVIGVAIGGSTAAVIAGGLAAYTIANLANSSESPQSTQKTNAVAGRQIKVKTSRKYR